MYLKNFVSLSLREYGSATSSDLSKKRNSSKKAHFSPTFSLSSNNSSREDAEMRKIEMEMMDEQSALAEGDEVYILRVSVHFHKSTLFNP